MLGVLEQIQPYLKKFQQTLLQSNIMKFQSTSC